MVCTRCQRSGYGFEKFEGKAVCPSCWSGFSESVIGGVRTITPGASNVGGRNTMEASEKSITPQEWREIAKLCKEISKK